MKMLGMVLGLCFAASAANANTILLELAAKDVAPGVESTIVHVWASGHVYGKVCRVTAQLPTYPVQNVVTCTESYFTRLNTVQMQAIHANIWEASKTAVQPPPTGGTHCTAEPKEVRSYRVRCSNMLLSTQTLPCGKDHWSNPSPAATELVSLLSSLEQQFKAIKP